jgi:hypothetical protein
MLSEIRPSFEVVPKGRILHFVSGDRKFVYRAFKFDYMKTNIREWKKFHGISDALIMEKAAIFLVWQNPQKFNDILLKVISF